MAVAVRRGDEVVYGFSLLNPIDKWDKKLGIEKAIARAESLEGYLLPTVPERFEMIIDSYMELEVRAVKYFKDIPPENIRLGPVEIEEV